MKQALISIIVPIYNAQAYLERCLLSIQGQTYKNLEILLIDDGSTDNSGAICDEYAKKDGRIKVFHKSNGGVSSARNFGLDKATGEYIGFVDSDDEIHPEMYERLYRISKEQEADVAVCKAVRRLDQCHFDLRQELQILTQAEDILCRLMTSGGVWNKLYRRECIANQQFNLALKSSEDLEWLVKISKNITKLVLSFDSLYIYYQIETSITNTPKISRWISEYKAWKWIFDYVKNKSFPRATAIAANFWLKRSLYLMAIFIFCNKPNQYAILFKRILIVFKKNFRLIKYLRKGKVFYFCLSLFPRPTILVMRLPFVRTFVNKRWHFDIYEV